MDDKFKARQTIKMRGISLKNKETFSTIAAEYEELVESGLQGAFRVIKLVQEKKFKSADMLETSLSRVEYFIKNTLSKRRIVKSTKETFVSCPYGFSE